MRKLLVVLATIALVVAGCGDDDDDAAAPPTTEQGADSATDGDKYSVALGGKTDAFNGEFSAFFPSKLAAHPGDEVVFELPTFQGEGHTITFGTLVDAAVAKLRTLSPDALPVQAEETPEMLKLPDVFPQGGAPGPPKLNQSAAQPCFLKTGTPPLARQGGAPACTDRQKPAFDGTQTYFNSGFFDEEGDSFSMTLSEGIKPGTYSFMCMLHRGIMTGELTVAAKGDKIPGPAEVKAAGKKEFDDAVAKLKPVAEQMQKATPDKAALGGGNPAAVGNALVAEFGPKVLNVKVGQTVTWNAFAFHTIAFNASDADVGITEKQADGSRTIPPKLAPAGFQIPPQAFVFPPPATSKPLTIDLGSYDGSGFKNTGVIASLPPQFVSFKITFTKAGTIPVRCLIHPDMKGEIRVS